MVTRRRGQFYLVWPLLLFLVLRSRVPAVAVAIAAVALIAWRVVLTNPDVTWDRIDYATDVNAAALLAGRRSRSSAFRRPGTGACWASAPSLSSCCFH